MESQNQEKKAMKHKKKHSKSTRPGGSKRSKTYKNVIIGIKPNDASNNQSYMPSS